MGVKPEHLRAPTLGRLRAPRLELGPLRVPAVLPCPRTFLTASVTSLLFRCRNGRQSDLPGAP